MDAKLKAKAMTDDQLDGVAGGRIVYDQNGEIAAALNANPYLRNFQERYSLPKDIKITLGWLGVWAASGDNEKNAQYIIDGYPEYHDHESVCTYLSSLPPEEIDKLVSKRIR